jgi:hypothetical protein
MLCTCKRDTDVRLAICLSIPLLQTEAVRGKISRALSRTIETNASFFYYFLSLIKATIAVVACLTKAYTSVVSTCK